MSWSETKLLRDEHSEILANLKDLNPSLEGKMERYVSGVNVPKSTKKEILSVTGKGKFLGSVFGCHVLNGTGTASIIVEIDGVQHQVSVKNTDTSYNMYVFLVVGCYSDIGDHATSTTGYHRVRFKGVQLDHSSGGGDLYYANWDEQITITEDKAVFAGFTSPIAFNESLKVYSTNSSVVESANTHVWYTLDE